ncbi:MAG: Crp/Fnr family transcriptional regulator [Saprospiraceae bacterium]|nr:MAG: Crp/Fnr family transcriptional regulator [Saprospiraceae bacterium]
MLKLDEPNPIFMTARISEIIIPTCDMCYSRLNSLFSDWEGKPVEAVVFERGCRCNRLPKGSAIFQEGTAALGMYYLNRGKVKIYKLGEGGKKQIVRLANKGDLIGYKALISGEVYSATAEVIDDTCLCFIPKNTFFEIITSTPEVCIKLMQRLAQDLNFIERMLIGVAQKPVRERVALAILTLKQTYGLEADEATISVELSREDIASIVGTATESIIRLLSEFKKDHIIDVQGRKIKILDHDRLLRAAYIFD